MAESSFVIANHKGLINENDAYMTWVMIVGSVVLWAGWIAAIAWATPKLDEAMIPHVVKVWEQDRVGVTATDFSFYLSACLVAGLSMVPLLALSALIL